MTKKILSLALLLALGCGSDFTLAGRRDSCSSCGSCSSDDDADVAPKCKHCGSSCSDDDSGSCSSCGGECGLFSGGKKSSDQPGKLKRSKGSSRKRSAE
ncbi:MAG TPA: hypothetical protein VJJ83_04700 [Candidatus Babeliales bacterium]|nr:hypothetical protein [Candidatus Babeliales bacterium]